MGSDTPFAMVSLEGIDVSSDIVSVNVEDHDRLIDKAVIVMDDPSETTGEVPREGHVLVVDIGWGSGHAVLFEGVVCDVRVEARGGSALKVIVKAFDLSYRLKRRPAVPVNHVGSLSGILSTIATGDSYLGIYPGQIELEEDPEFTYREPLRQTSRTDWDFIQELARRYGCRAFVEYNDGNSRFYFISLNRMARNEPMGTLSYRGGTGQLIEINFQRLASSASPVVRAVTMDQGGAVVRGTETRVSIEPPIVPRSSAISRSPGRRLERAMEVTGQAMDAPENQRPDVRAAGLPSDPELVRRLPFQDPTNVLGLSAFGECVGTVMLRAKGKVEITGVASWAEGDWYVRKANHIYDRSAAGSGPGYRTRFFATR